MSTTHPAWEDEHAWDEPDPGCAFPLRNELDLQRLGHRYPALHGRPLNACLRHAMALGAVCVVIETRYIDPDYRSEYSAFYSKTFSSISDSTHRLHFFATPIEDDQLADLPPDAEYIGYCVIRPNPISRVSRTMLPPLPEDRAAVRCGITQTVQVFGQPFTVQDAVPFQQQDTLLGRCAHVAAWVCHSVMASRQQMRWLPVATFSEVADPALSLARPVPSQGLTDSQTMQILRASGASPTAYLVPDLHGRQKYGMPTWAFAGGDVDPPQRHPEHPMMRVLCRYLDSGIPVLVNVDEHAFVIIGYRRVPDPVIGERVELVRHDDARGPYQWVIDPYEDRIGPRDQIQAWRSMIVPLPDKLWLPSAAAEAAGGRLLREAAAAMAARGSEHATAFLRLMDQHGLTLRSFAMLSTTFKTGAAGRLSPDVVAAYRVLRCSRSIWVTEAVLRDRIGRPDCVVGEVVLDGTSGEFAPNPLAAHIPGHLLSQRAKGVAEVVLTAEEPYVSAGTGPLLGFDPPSDHGMGVA